MKEEKKESPIGVLWGWGKPYHGKFIGSVILAVLGVACQMVPYFCVAHIVTMMLSGEQNFSRYVTAGIIALCGYFGKVLFSCLSTTISHTATYYTLRDLRENITAKLARVPMGTILDTPSGQYKTTIVDRVEGMESTFAHLLPEMTANVLVPLVIVVYLFVMDWRMALLSLVTLVVGLAVMSAGMKNYPVKWEGAVKAGKQMANAIVEYIGGIEVVKAFSQSAGSYKKYSDAVNYNANYYVALSANLRAALRLRVLALRKSGAFHLPVHCDFLAGADRADYCGLYLYGRFGRTGDKCGRNQPASERRRTEP